MKDKSFASESSYSSSSGVDQQKVGNGGRLSKSGSSWSSRSSSKSSGSSGGSRNNRRSRRNRRNRSRSRSSSSGRSSGSGSSYSSVRSQSDSISSQGVSEGDALEMLRRFDSEFARVMATNQHKMQKGDVADSSRSNTNMNHSNQTMEEKGVINKSIMRPATAVPTRSSPKRILSRPFSSIKVREKSRKKGTVERPNDKDRMDRRAARRKKYKSLATSKAAVRVYRSIGKKSEPVDKSGRWR